MKSQQRKGRIQVTATDGTHIFANPDTELAEWITSDTVLYQEEVR